MLSGAKGETEALEPTRLEQTIARRSAEARATVPDISMSAEVEISACLERVREEAVSLEALLIAACAQALAQTPRANGSYRDGRFELHRRINIGVVVETESAQVAATVFDAGQKQPGDLSIELEELQRRAMAGELAPPDLAGATFTFSNPGRHGVSSATPLVQPPQAAAIAAGAVREAPVLRDGAIVPGHLMTLTLACDHRILFEAEAARFLGRIRELLESR